MKENKSVNKEQDMDKSSVICSSAEYGSISASGEDLEKGYNDMGELNQSPMFHVLSLMKSFKPFNKA